MNEALLLEKLDSLATEIEGLKKEIRQIHKPPQQENSHIPSDPKNTELDDILKDFTCTLADMRELKKSMTLHREMTDNLKPETKQRLPEAINCIGEIDEDEFSIDELKILITKALTSLEAITEVLDMLKSGVELRDELVPIFKLSYPKVQKFLNALHEGEFQAEQLGTLLHTMLLNIHTFSDLMNMISPFTEFVKEFEVVMKQTDVLSNLNKWLDSLQQGNGMLRLFAFLATALKRIDLSDEQYSQLCDTLTNVSLSQVEPVGPLGMIRQMRDPKIQEALGVMFVILETFGSCVQVCKAHGSEQA